MCYDAASRLSTVSDGVNTATYFYVANSSLVDHIVFAHGGANVMTTQNTYDNLNRLTGKTSALDFSYQYNAAGQRTRVTLLSDGSYWLYGYDALGQLTSARKYFWDGTPYAGQQFGFTFDTIGNRTVALSGGDSAGASLRTNIYSDNLLNQVTSRTVPGYVDILGLALLGNAVWVNGSNAYQKSEYFREQWPVSNASAAVWTNMTVTTPLATNSGGLFVAQTPESFNYDLDGNLTSDGRYNYTWDGENRLITMTSLTNAPTASMVSLAFTYDYMGRRIQKIVSTNSASGWVVSYTNKFVYDGWNVVAILDGTNNLLYTFTWGTDLSGSMQGAGGVGGLISITYCAPNAGTNAGTYFPCYDGNGNVVALVNAANGGFAGNWEYGPFGELIRATGPMAKLNPFMFSTKCYDWESGLYYYGHRYYNPSTGRWPSRDPIEEEGGNNLYASSANDLINAYDYLGFAIGTHLTEKEAKELACQINKWLDDARDVDTILGSTRDLTLRFLHHYMSKEGTMITVPYSEISNEKQTQWANSQAIEKLGGKTSGAINLYKASFGWANHDLSTSFGRVIFHYRIDHNGTILGEILDHYTFLDTAENDKDNVHFPKFGWTLTGWCCGWKGGDVIQDQWMADLERFNLAKSFISHIEWTVP